MPHFMFLDQHSAERMNQARRDYIGTDKPRNLLWESPDFAAVGDRVQATVSASNGKRKAVAILPLSGLLEHTQSFYGWVMGGTDLRMWGAAFDSLVANDSVKAICILANTPGGTAFGTPEAADKVFRARGTKPIVTVCDPQMCSAGYYIGSAADRVFVMPSSEIGSIGTVMMHVDQSAALEMDGIKVEVIASGANKYEGHSYGPLSDETRAVFKADIESMTGDFREAVARHRGVTVNDVKSKFGEGRVFLARDAVERGMADKVVRLERVLAQLDSGRIDTTKPASHDNWDAPEKVMSRPYCGDEMRELALRGR